MLDWIKTIKITVFSHAVSVFKFNHFFTSKCFEDGLITSKMVISIQFMVDGHISSLTNHLKREFNQSLL